MHTLARFQISKRVTLSSCQILTLTSYLIQTPRNTLRLDNVRKHVLVIHDGPNTQSDSLKIYPSSEVSTSGYLCFLFLKSYVYRTRRTREFKLIKYSAKRRVSQNIHLKQHSLNFNVSSGQSLVFNISVYPRGNFIQMVLENITCVGFNENSLNRNCFYGGNQCCGKRF